MKKTYSLPVLFISILCCLIAACIDLPPPAENTAKEQPASGGQQQGQAQAQQPAQQAAVTYAKESDFTVVREGNGIRIDEYDGTNRELHIPPHIQNLPVTNINSMGFTSNGPSILTAVTIPASVTFIGEGAFWGNNLTSVTIKGMLNTSSGSVIYNPFFRAKLQAGGPGTYTRQAARKHGPNSNAAPSQI